MKSRPHLQDTTSPNALSNWSKEGHLFDQEQNEADLHMHYVLTDLTHAREFFKSRNMRKQMKAVNLIREQWIQFLESEGWTRVS